MRLKRILTSSVGTVVFLAGALLYRQGPLAAFPDTTTKGVTTGTVTVPSAPSVTLGAITPSIASDAGGTVLAVTVPAINGTPTKLTVAGVEVKFSYITSFLITSGGVISFTAPPVSKLPGIALGAPVPVIATVTSGTKSYAGDPASFTYVASSAWPGWFPVVAGFSPQYAYAVPSATVVGPAGGLVRGPFNWTSISGSGFSGATAVNFGASTLQPADPHLSPYTPQFLVVDDDQILAWSLAGDPSLGNNVVLVTVTTPAGTSSNTFQSYFVFVDPLDLVSPPVGVTGDPRDGMEELTDMNGFLWNPQWGAVAVNSVSPDPAYFCPPSGSTISFAPPSCTATSQVLASNTDSSGECDFATGEDPQDQCNYTPQHVNYQPVTYDGQLYWEDFSNDWLTDDYDYNFALHTPSGAGSDANNDDQPPGSLHLEYDSREVDGYFGYGKWWPQFQYMAQGNALAPCAADPVSPACSVAILVWNASIAKLGLNRGVQAVVIGLFGLDCCHSCKSELHPVYAMAIEEPASFSGGNDVWAIMARNWGDEGACGNGSHIISDASGADVTNLTIRIPWRPGSPSVEVISLAGNGDNVGTPTASAFDLSSVDAYNGIYVTIPLKDPNSIPSPDNADSDTGPSHWPIWVGELTLKWAETYAGSGGPTPSFWDMALRPTLTPSPGPRKPYVSDERQWSERFQSQLTPKERKALVKVASVRRPKTAAHRKAAAQSPALPVVMGRALFSNTLVKRRLIVSPGPPCPRNATLEKVVRKTLTSHRSKTRAQRLPEMNR